MRFNIISFSESGRRDEYTCSMYFTFFFIRLYTSCLRLYVLVFGFARLVNSSDALFPSIHDFKDII